MTLNKAQGKTFSRGLLLLTRDVHLLMANCMSVLHDLEQHPTSLFSSLLNSVSMDGLSCSTWCHHLLLNLSTNSLLHCDRRPPLGGRTRLVKFKKTTFFSRFDLVPQSVCRNENVWRLRRNVCELQSRSTNNDRRHWIAQNNKHWDHNRVNYSSSTCWRRRTGSLTVAVCA